MEELTILLQNISSGSTDAVNSATFQLSQMYKNPLSLVMLIDICCSQKELSLRQLAAIEARKNVKAGWIKIDEPLKTDLKGKLLSFILSENE